MFKNIFNKKKEENEIVIKNELSRSIRYLLDGSNIGTQPVERQKVLIKILKIICSSLNYQMAYQTLRVPHSTANITGWYYPKNYYEVKKYKTIELMENPVYIESNEAAMIVQPWNNERIVDNLLHIGGDSGNDLDESNMNIINAYIYPLGIVMCENGNHSQFSGILQNDMKQIKITSIIDISESLDTVTVDEEENLKSEAYFDFEDSVYTEEIKDIFRIGLYLRKFPEVYPDEIIKKCN
ncbi:hypothetical protein H3T41_07065 [Lactobacillus sp. W8089]|nr:hypothetical protein [Lactobacillus sp. W8086]MBI0109449.1 hypothetical protein [Lactobacillus sp. W8085]MBI0112636.1 hypothetical protein [Lactobacillus sp. W8088]MBI0116352.1 hypothetical protein [Lactobacillus sp. W8087]MBI0120106.1 hypothetical protein [Lactobacillus sp. W8089]MBI0132071.1 hypothetical protein [Lactobacillus sp. W8090]